MAILTLGIGTSHSPQLSTKPDIWWDHAKRDQHNPYLLGLDGQYYTYAEHLERFGPVDNSLIEQERFEEYDRKCQAAIAEIANALASSAPDIVVIVGDDQDEFFREDGLPTFAIYTGAILHDEPLPESKLAARSIGEQLAVWAEHSSRPVDYRCHHGLAQHVLEHLMDADFDMTNVKVQPVGREAGHAYTFVPLRLMEGVSAPLLPVFVNTYYPPTQPSPSRSYDFGVELGRAIESYEEDLRVAIVASGGLSHFIIDEGFDRKVLDAIQRGDDTCLRTLPRSHLRSGTSEILNWIVVAAAMRAFTFRIVDYVPAYRSVAGTGVGMAFATWTGSQA